MAGSTAHIIKSLIANTLIAGAKGVAAVITGSGAMLAETIHSAADCGNQLLLLFGVQQARKPATASHPLGYGRALYFWSFMVAMLLFVGGGAFSIYEGIHKLQAGHAEPVGDIGVALAVLVVALAIEGWATIGNIIELNQRRQAKPFWSYLRSTKDSDLVVVFGENSAAVLGLVLALGALLLAKVTDDPRWDAFGSLAVGAVLVFVAVFLAIEVKSLLVGESADPEIEHAVRALAISDPNIEAVLRIITVQQGPGEVVVAMKIRFNSGLATGGALCAVINGFEEKLRAKVPSARWCFIEPDVCD
jgi:cation diffusion facilitator family transporter